MRTEPAPRTAWTDMDARVARFLTRRRSRGGSDLALASALRTLVAAMRAGATLPQALARASDRAEGTVGAAFAHAASRIALGCAVEVEVDRLADRIGTPAARLFAQVVRIQHRRGGDLGDPCHRLAGLLHERTRLDGEARAATAQARFSARAVLAIPALLAIAAAWRAPEATRAMLQPGPLLLAGPGIFLVLAGAVVARRIARAALDVGAVDRRSRTTPRWRTTRLGIAGSSASPSRCGARRAIVAGALLAPVLVASVGALVSLPLVLVACLVAGFSPWMDQASSRREHERVVASGIESLLEVSIALLAAGASAHQVATVAPAGIVGPLREALAPAVHQVGLGRTIASAFDLPHVSASPQLDGWLHAICASAELGAPAIDVLEQHLRDARAERRDAFRSVAQTAGPRMQLALVLLVVPGVMWIMLLATVGGLVGQLRGAGIA